MNKVLNYINKRKINILIVFIFVTISIILGLKHEPWADETQAWLLSRDSNLFDIFFKYLHDEGHPALWYIIIKIFQLFGLSYKYFFVIPIVFSTIGITLFLEKTRFPWYIKYFIPFTYFIFYQYTIVARSYCLILPLLMLFSIVWNSRYNKKWKFILVMILIINTEVYTFLFATGVWIYLAYEFFKERKNLDKNKKVDRLYMLLLLAFMFIVTFSYVYPTKYTSFTNKNNLYYLSDSFFTPFSDKNQNIKILSTVCLCIYVLNYIYMKNREGIIRLGLFIVPPILFMLFKYCNFWHFGIIFLMFLCIIEIENLCKNKKVKILIVFTMIFQIIWAYNSAMYDYNNSCCDAESVANKIKEYDYEKLSIVGTCYNTIAINGYFEKNIFDNFDEGKSFFYLNKRSKFYQESYLDYYLEHNKPDIIIYSMSDSLTIEKYMKEYNKYAFKGSSVGEGKIIMDQTYIMYVRKDIDNML